MNDALQRGCRARPRRRRAARRRRADGARRQRRARPRARAGGAVRRRQSGAAASSIPDHRILDAAIVGASHVRARIQSGDGTRLDAIAFRVVGTPIGDALLRGSRAAAACRRATGNECVSRIGAGGDAHRRSRRPGSRNMVNAPLRRAIPVLWRGEKDQSRRILVAIALSHGEARGCGRGNARRVNSRVIRARDIEACDRADFAWLIGARRKRGSVRPRERSDTVPHFERMRP